MNKVKSRIIKGSIIGLTFFVAMGCAYFLTPNRPPRQCLTAGFVPVSPAGLGGWKTVETATKNGFNPIVFLIFSSFRCKLQNMYVMLQKQCRAPGSFKTVYFSKCAGNRPSWIVLAAISRNASGEWCLSQQVPVRASRAEPGRVLFLLECRRACWIRSESRGIDSTLLSGSLFSRSNENGLARAQAALFICI